MNRTEPGGSPPGSVASGLTAMLALMLAAVGDEPAGGSADEAPIADDTTAQATDTGTGVDGTDTDATDTDTDATDTDATDTDGVASSDDGGDSTQTTDGTGSETDTATGSDHESGSGNDGTGDSEAGTDDAETDEAGSDDAGSDGAGSDDSSDADAGDGVEESRGVVRGGQIFLEGAVPTAEAGAEIEALAAEILGADNVFNNYVVDPRAGDSGLDNLTVEDTINSATNSSVILPESEELLNQGLALLSIRPNMTILIVGHTDSRGSAADNLELSEQRAEAVKEWLVDRGVDGDRLTTEGAGESDPIADNDTTDGQRLNRRIQFFLENLLG